MILFFALPETPAQTACRVIQGLGRNMTSVGFVVRREGIWHLSVLEFSDGPAPTYEDFWCWANTILDKEMERLHGPGVRK